ncbi:MAG TPA: alpha/beta fold hydrolase [Mycobacterium sp.]|jgi:pimeloyl-ACP methyl ester carboxylesterase|nr:alpha/beta fold hydrolase [Mycobacterium sp.]
MSGAAGEPSAQRDPFVLVHGSGHGGWCWIRVARLLRAAGNEVFTPTLTGHGERAHLLTADVGPATMVRDIVAVLENEELRSVVLVGHSFGALVTLGVADRVPHRLRRLVLLDGLVVEPGERGFDGFPPEGAESRAAAVKASATGLAYPMPSATAFGLTDPRPRPRRRGVGGPPAHPAAAAHLQRVVRAACPAGQRSAGDLHLLHGPALPRDPLRPHDRAAAGLGVAGTRHRTRRHDLRAGGDGGRAAALTTGATTPPWRGRPSSTIRLLGELAEERRGEARGGGRRGAPVVGQRHQGGFEEPELAKRRPAHADQPECELPEGKTWPISSPAMSLPSSVMWSACDMPSDVG